MSFDSLKGQLEKKQLLQVVGCKIVIEDFRAMVKHSDRNCRLAAQGSQGILAWPRIKRKREEGKRLEKDDLFTYFE